MKRSWSFYNSGSGFSNANTGPGTQYNNNAAGPQYNYNYYGSLYSGTDQERERRNCEKQECLRSLSFSNIDARRQDIALVHANTGDWIFETTEFRRWRDRTHLSEYNGVLWIKGHPGTGKSTLMKHIWRYYHREFRDRTIAAYFFHARGDSLEKTPLGMLRSLVYQLVDNEEPTYQRFLSLFRQKNQLHQNWEWRESELKEFLLSEMQVGQRPPLVILIDALDECSDSNVRDVVRFLEQLSITCIGYELNVCICLSSRHYPHITMAKYQEFVIETRTGHDADIAIYVHDNLTKSNPDIEKGVLKKASGIFMWVVLVVAMLNRAYDEGKIEAMEQKLREVPSDLDELFSAILSKENPDKHEAILMLQWVLFAVRPLQPEELYYATLAGTGATNLGPWDRSQLTADDIQRRITYSSKGLIEVLDADGVTVQFIHESVKDFLLRNQRLQTLDPALESNPIGQSHDRLKNCCVSFIRSRALLLDDIPMGDDSDKRLWVNSDKRWKYQGKRWEIQLKNPFLRYASLFWLEHAESAEAGKVSQTEFLRGIKEDHGLEQLSYAHTCFCGDPFHNKPECKKGDDLLYISMAHSHNNVARILLEHGADISPQGWNYDLALHASFNSSTEIARLLITRYGADPNGWDGGHTPLLYAIRYGPEEIVRLLLDHGADVNAISPDYGTPLGLAVSPDYGTALGQTVKHGRFPRRTVSEGQDLIKLLLKRGAKINASYGSYANNALHEAASCGYEEIVRFLLENGADVNGRGGEYGTALQAAAALPHYLTRLIPMSQMLLNYGADVNAQGGRYGTALQAAFSRLNVDLHMFLLEHGATL